MTISWSAIRGYDPYGAFENFGAESHGFLSLCLVVAEDVSGVDSS